MTHELPLAGKTALITGAARRIGAAIARTLHGQGMNIVLHYRRSDAQARELMGRLNRQRPDSAALAQAELLNTGELGALITKVRERWGRLDVLINNASSFHPTPVGRISERDWDDLIGTNLKAPLFLAQAAAAHLRVHTGCIINIVDIHAERPLKGYLLYSVAKAGLVMLTKSLARELAPEVRVNAIAPGAILWPEIEDYEAMHQEIIERTALKRQGSPDDIAKTALFLIRDAEYITGQTIAVEGGRTLSN
jgi:pteridine reductase